VPRDDIEVPVRLERLHVLGEDGDVDDELAPDLGDDELRRIHRVMLLSRRFDERRLQLQKQHRIGTFAPAIGQEASQVGAASALTDDDWVVPSYRESCVLLWRGVDPVDLLLYDAGYNEGAAVPEGSRNLPIAVPVASQIPHAAGLGYAARLAGDGEVVMVFFGDGATSEGDFHEAINFAAVQRCPVVFVCENNQYAISTPVEEQMASATIVQKAAAYGVPGIQVDGNDVLGVRVAADEAVDRARSGDGPTLVECVTYRLSVHTTADDPSAYRSEEEEDEWRRRDPLSRTEQHLRTSGVLDDDAVDALAGEVDAEVDGLWDEAERRIADLGGPEVMFDHLVAERPPYLERQRREVAGDGGDDG
jgi:pyruvate dehydrogenase E1 component alpha subunit